MSKQQQDYMSQWASKHGKALRQLSVHKNNTKHAAQTLPLNMYLGKSYLLVTESLKNPVQLMILVTSCQGMILTPATIEDCTPQEKDEDTVVVVPVNLLLSTARMCTGQQITLSYPALSSY